MDYPFEYPRDRKSADAALIKFPDFATNLSFSSVFEEALWIIYGRNYAITTDLTKRMNFFCKICRKTMNCITALTAHHHSGAHAKNADKSDDDFSGGPKRVLASKYLPNSLQYEILHSHAKILGAHLIEGYSRSHHDSPRYFKCLLCGAHGNIEAIIQHVKNDKHTDRYIRYNYYSDVRVFSPEVRTTLRLEAFKRDGVRVEDIITITDKSLYPTRWEDEVLSLTKLRNKRIRAGFYNGRSSRSPPRSHRGSRERSLTKSIKKEAVREDRSPLRSTVKREADEDEVNRKVAAFLRSLKSSTDAVNPERRPSDSRSVSRLSTRDMSVQVIGQDRIEKMLTKLNFIVQTSTLPGSVVETPEDVKECLRYMFSVGSLLYQALSARVEKSSEPAQRERNLRLKENISKAQGCVKNTYEEDWRKRNAGPCLGDLIEVWVRTCLGNNSRPVKTEHKERAAK